MMNFKNKNLSIGVTLLGIFALSFALHADAQQADSPFCNHPDITPDMKPLCLKMIGGATTWDQAATFCVNRVLRKANRVKPLLATIEAKLLPSLPISKRSQINDICKNGFQDAVDGLQKCQNLIKSPSFADVGSVLTSAYTSFEDCRDAIVEERGQPEIVEVTHFNNRIQRLIDIALVIAKQDPRLAEYNLRLAKGQFKDSQGDPNLIGAIPQDFFGAHL